MARTTRFNKRRAYKKRKATRKHRKSRKQYDGGSCKLKPISDFFTDFSKKQKPGSIFGTTTYQPHIDGYTFIEFKDKSGNVVSVGQKAKTLFHGQIKDVEHNNDTITITVLPFESDGRCGTTVRRLIYDVTSKALSLKFTDDDIQTSTTPVTHYTLMTILKLSNKCQTEKCIE